MRTLSEKSNDIVVRQSQLRVLVLPAGFSGCSWWRYRLPLKKLCAIGTDLSINIADNADKIIRADAIKRHAEKADIMDLQSPGGEDATFLMAIYKYQGKRVVIDYDDFSYDLSPGNPRYDQLGTRECEVLDKSGKILFRWRDGENGFDLKANISRYEHFIQELHLADMVTTTTEYLADKFKPHSKNVFIRPNSVDFDLWKPLPRPVNLDGQIRVGWFGGDSHTSDLDVFRMVLPKIMARYPNVRLVIQSGNPPGWAENFKDLPSDRFEWIPWKEQKWYTLFLADRHFDIGLCPLEDSQFNKCKSNIKFLEFAALKVPCIAQDMIPYSNTIKEGETGLLAGQFEEWEEKISHLIEQPKLRMDLAEAAYKYAFENYNMDKNCKFWEESYKQVAA